MIRIDITSLMFLYTLFSVVMLLVVWAVLGYRKFKGVARQDQGHIENAWKCSICFHAYIDSLHDDISVCPLCGSYNKRA
jgi:hypothetical protein